MSKIRTELERIKQEYSFIDIANTLDTTIRQAKAFKSILTEKWNSNDNDDIDDFTLFYHYEFGDTEEIFEKRARTDFINEFSAENAYAIVQYETNLKMIKIYEDAMSELLHDMKEGI